MNLYEFQKEYNLILLKIKHITDKIMLIRNSLEPWATDIRDSSVQTSPRKDKITDKVHAITELEKELEELDRQVATYIPTIEEMEKILKEFNDRDQLIYLEYYLKGYSAVKIGDRYSLSDRQIRNIVKKVEENLKSSVYFLDKVLK